MAVLALGLEDRGDVFRERDVLGNGLRRHRCAGHGEQRSHGENTCPKVELHSSHHVITLQRGSGCEKPSIWGPSRKVNAKQSHANRSDFEGLRVACWLFADFPAAPARSAGYANVFFWHAQAHGLPEAFGNRRSERPSSGNQRRPPMHRLLMTALLLVGFATLHAQAQDAAAHKEWMDTLGDLQDDLREHLGVKSSEKSEAAATQIGRILAQTQAYWAAKHADDIVAIAQESRTLATAVATAA